MSELELFAVLGEEIELTAAASDSGMVSMLPSSGIQSSRKPSGLRGVDATGRRLARINPTPIRENPIKPRRPQQNVNRQIGRRGTLGPGNFGRDVTPTPGAGPDLRIRRRGFIQPERRSVSTPVINFGPPSIPPILQDTQIEGAGSLLGANLSPIAEGENIPFTEITPPSNVQATEEVLPPPVAAEAPVQAQVPVQAKAILPTRPPSQPIPNERPVQIVFSTSMPAADALDIRNQMAPLEHQLQQMASDVRNEATTTPEAAGIDVFRQNGPILTEDVDRRRGPIQGRIQSMSSVSFEERRVSEIANPDPSAGFFNSEKFPTSENTTLDPRNTPTPLRRNDGPTRDPSSRPRAPLMGQQEEPSALFGATPGGAALPTIEQQQAQVDAGGRIGRLQASDGEVVSSDTPDEEAPPERAELAANLDPENELNVPDPNTVNIGSDGAVRFRRARGGGASANIEIAARRRTEALAATRAANAIFLESWELIYQVRCQPQEGEDF